MAEELELEPIRDVNDRVAKEVHDQQVQFFSWMRRHTTLDDDAVFEAVQPLSQAHFDAGHEIGFSEALHKAQVDTRGLRFYRLYALVVSAACVAFAIVY